MKTVIYARFSSDKQSEASIDDQVRNCTRYAERYSWTVASCFEDRAITGATKIRPGYQAMLAAAERKEFEVLLVDDLSRLSRDEVEMKQVIRRFKFHGIRIIGISDGYDSAMKGKKIQSSLRGLMNEMYLDDLRDKTHRGLTGKVLGGFSAGGRVYAYKSVPIEHPSKQDAHGRPEIMAVKREINEEEAGWVRQIFTWFAQGKSPKWIASELNRQRIPSPRASTWAASAIYGESSEGTGLLNNPLYNGRYVWNRSEWKKDPDTGKRKRILRPESEWVVTDMPELRIVPPELWDAVRLRQADIQEKSANLRKALNNPKSRSHAGKYLFSGLLKCGCCGANYTMHSTTSYGCAVNLNRGDAACANRLRVPRRVVEEVLLATIQDKLFTPDAIDVFVKEAAIALNEHETKQQPDVEALRQRMEKAEQQIANIMEAIKAGIITTSTKTALEMAEAERTELESALNTDTAISNKVTGFLPDAAGRYKSIIANLRESLSQDITQAQQHLKILVGTV